MQAVRIGLVGAGFMGKIHSIAYRNAAMLFGHEVPAVDPVVVTDFDPALADRAVSDWGWSRSVRDWHDVTSSNDVDVVDICTPNDTHVDIALDALARGKHVLCEKPLALDGDGAHQTDPYCLHQESRPSRRRRGSLGTGPCVQGSPSWNSTNC